MFCRLYRQSVITFCKIFRFESGCSFVKKIPALLFYIALLLFMVGCQTESRSDNTGSASDPPMISDSDTAEVLPTGTTETFTYHDLILDVSNVYEVQTTSGIYDDGETYEYPVYICYPGATLTIVNAGMSDPTYEEDHQPRPQWGVYDIETDTRVNLADGMEPIVLDETTDAVFNLEASVFVLKFHFYEPQ